MSAAKPRTLADSLGLLGQGLLVSWALLLYYLVTQWRVVYDPRNSQVYAAAVLLWLALSLIGLGRIALALIRRAHRAPDSGNRRPSPDSRFIASYEDDHDDHTDRDDEERNNDPARARRRER